MIPEAASDPVPAPPSAHVPAWRWPLAGALLLALAIAILAVVAARSAAVGITLRVRDGHATLQVDGQVVQTTWFSGTAWYKETAHDPNARLFQVDGSDTSGTLSYSARTFAPIAHSRYYGFLCWLRDCSSYSTWRDLSVRNDMTGHFLLASGNADALRSLTLPARFTLTATFSRPDVAGSLAFTNHRSSITLSLDPDQRRVHLGMVSLYYPHDWRPYLALAGWTLTRAYLWSLAVLLLILFAATLLALIWRVRWRIRPRVQPLRLSSVLDSWSTERAWSVILAVASSLLLVVLLTISDRTFHRLPRILDAASYYFQASVLASGHLSASPPPGQYLFAGPFMLVLNGRWFSQYPPGTPLALALGMKVHLQWAIEPIMGAVGAVLMTRLARRWYGTLTALLVLLLVGLSPFYLFLASSYLSHMVALFALLLFLEGMDRLATTGRARWALLAGSGWSYAFVTREFSALLFALPVVAFYSRDLIRACVQSDLLRSAQVWRVILCLTGPLILCGLGYTFYNWQLTGDPLLTPRTALHGYDSWGFGAGKGWNGQHTVAAGLFILENQLTSLLIHLFGWPYYLTLSFFFVPLATLRLRSHDLLLYGLAASYLLGYVGYFYHGIAFGPRYLFESFPAYVLLTARGVVEASTLVARVLRRYVPAALAVRCGVIASGGVLAAFCACNLGFYLPLQFPLYEHYQQPVVRGGLSSAALHPPWLHHAIVLTDRYTFYATTLFPLNDPALSGDVLYVYYPSYESIQPLLDRFPGRKLYTVTVQNQQLVFHLFVPNPRISSNGRTATSDDTLLNRTHGETVHQ